MPSLEKITIVLSPSSLGTLQSCPRRYYYYKKRNLGLEGPKDEKLERGDLIHRVNDFYYRGLIEGKTHAEMVEPAIDFGRYQAIDMSLEIEASEYFLSTTRDYLYYADQHYGWEPLFSEEPFSFIFYEDEGLKVLMEGKIDLVVRLKSDPTIIAWVDHKSKDKTAYISKLDNQFKCYSLAFKDIAKYGFVNIIGLQKTLPSEKKFRIETLTYSDSELEEWRDNSLYYIKQLEGFIREDFYPMNHSSCWSCQFKDICDKPANLREDHIIGSSKYSIMPAHDLFGAS